MSLSSIVVSAGEVAAGDTITTLPGIAALLAAAIVSPEQSGPTSAVTFSALTMRSAAFEAAVASAQVESPCTMTSWPSRMPPCSLICLTASLAPSWIGGTSVSIGPVKPPRKPILTSAAEAAEAAIMAAPATDAARMFRMLLRIWVTSLECFLNLRLAFAAWPRLRSGDTVIAGVLCKAGVQFRSSGRARRR